MSAMDMRLVQCEDGAPEWSVYDGAPRDDLANWLGDVLWNGREWTAVPAVCSGAEGDDCHGCVVRRATRAEAIAYLVARAEQQP